MYVLGLTGSIGMGKSTAAGFFRLCGVWVHDSDAAVHRLMAAGGAALAAVGAAFPDAVRGEGRAAAVDRKTLGGMVFGEPAALARLEAILHPMVRDDARAFLFRAAAWRRRVVVMDIPLLYETGGEARCDAVCVVSAPAFVQEARVLARPGMTRERLAEIRRRQMPDAEKRRRADFVIPTGLGKRESLNRVRAVVRMVDGRQGRIWPPC